MLIRMCLLGLRDEMVVEHGRLVSGDPAQLSPR